jgi:hypothetical protein
LIIGGLLVVLVIIGGIALAILGGRLAQQIADNPDAFLGSPCPFASAPEISNALGTDVEVLTLEGFADGTIGSALDKRLLRDAPDCYIVGQGGTAGRIALLDAGGPGAFAAARADAERFILRDTDEIGDEAFCTEVGSTGSGGVLVRFGQRVIYVSMLDRQQDSDNACAAAVAVARTMER